MLRVRNSTKNTGTLNVIVDPGIQQQIIFRIRLSVPADKANTRMLNSSTTIHQLTAVNVYNLTAN